MFFDLPEWIFTVVYIAFFAFLLLTFWIVKPEPRKTPHTNSLERA